MKKSVMETGLIQPGLEVTCPVQVFDVEQQGNDLVGLGCTARRAPRTDLAARYIDVHGSSVCPAGRDCWSARIEHFQGALNNGPTLSTECPERR